jgi:hypothetical protein
MDTTGQYAGKFVDPFVDVSLWNIPRGSDFEKIMAGQADTTSLNNKTGKKICPKGMIETIKSANSSKNRPIASIVCVPYVQNSQKLECHSYTYTGEQLYNIKHTAGRGDDRASYQCGFDTNTYNKTITSAYTDEKGVTTTYNYVVDELGRQVNFKRAVSVFLVNDCRLCM